MTHTKQPWEYLPLSFSSLCRFAESPLSFLHYKTQPRTETAAMRLGTLVHRHVLEPDEFMESVVCYEGTRRGNAWKDFEAAHEGKDIVTATEWNTIMNVKDALTGSRHACQLLAALDYREMMIEWPSSGLPHRGIVDGTGSGIVVDLKVTNNVNPRALTSMIWERRYNMQAAMYAHGLTYHGHDIDECYIIAVQSGAPHHVRCIRLAPHYITRGNDEWMRLLQLFKAWDGDAYHSHSEDEAMMEVDAPSWAPLPDWMKE